MTGRNLLAVEFYGKVIRVCSDRVRGIKRPRRIDEKTGAGNLSVLINRPNLDDRRSGPIEYFFNLAAKGAGRLLLRAQPASDGKKAQC